MAKKVMVLLGSARAGRAGDSIMTKLKLELDKHKDITWDIVDLKELALPFYDEPLPPLMINMGMGDYQNKDGKAWAARVGEADGYIFVTPEYNHSFTAILKNAIDWVGKEWNNKPAAFVSYGAMSGGIRAIEQLRQVVLEVRLQPLHDAVHIPHVYAAFNEKGEWNDEKLNNAFDPMLEELVAALK